MYIVYAILMKTYFYESSNVNDVRVKLLANFNSQSDAARIACELNKHNRDYSVKYGYGKI